jgi:hypothetical protein
MLGSFRPTFLENYLFVCSVGVCYFVISRKVALLGVGVGSGIGICVGIRAFVVPAPRRPGRLIII